MSPKCNCREKNTCPLNGNCQTTSVIYQAKVKTATDPEKTYRTYRRDMKAKKLHTQIIIQQLKIHQQHYIIKAYMEINGQQPSTRDNLVNQNKCPCIHQHQKEMHVMPARKMAIITFPDEDSLLNKRS